MEHYEESRSLAIAASGDKFLLGTEWHLRLYDQQGKQIWSIPRPEMARGVQLTADGRYAIPAIGDGTIR